MRKLFLGIFGVILVILMLWKGDIFRGIVGLFLKPFWKVEASLGEGVKIFFGKYGYLVGVKEENIKLKEKIMQLEQELAYYKEREALYQKLEHLYKLVAKENVPQVVAKIIYKGIDPYSDFFIIDKGNKDGLTTEMPVLALVGDRGLGLVGQIVEVNRNWSKVMLV
ncbi:MAG: rod shape-determining protein MreC, partial [Caldimicrobium sp.]